MKKFFYKFKKYKRAFQTENERQIQEIFRRNDAVIGALRTLCSERILQIYANHKMKNSITKQKNRYHQAFILRLSQTRRQRHYNGSLSTTLAGLSIP